MVGSDLKEKLCAYASTGLPGEPLFYRVTFEYSLSIVKVLEKKLQ